MDVLAATDNFVECNAVYEICNKNYISLKLGKRVDKWI